MSRKVRTAGTTVGTDGSLRRLLETEEALGERLAEATAQAERILAEADAAIAAAEAAFGDELAAALEAEEQAAEARRRTRLEEIDRDARERTARLAAIPDDRVEALADGVVVRVLSGDGGAAP